MLSLKMTRFLIVIFLCTSLQASEFQQKLIMQFVGISSIATLIDIPLLTCAILSSGSSPEYHGTAYEVKISIASAIAIQSAGFILSSMHDSALLLGITSLGSGIAQVYADARIWRNLSEFYQGLGVPNNHLEWGILGISILNAVLIYGSWMWVFFQSALEIRSMSNNNIAISQEV